MLCLRLADGLRALLAADGRAVVAVNGLEQMEARFARAVQEATSAVPVSATAGCRRNPARQDPGRDRVDPHRPRTSPTGATSTSCEVCEPGMTEFELVAEVESFVKAHGAEDNFMLVASGGTEVTGMKPPTARRFQPGDSVTTELTPQINGYYAQICRTLVIGEPSAAQLEAYSIFAAAQQAAQDSPASGGGHLRCRACAERCFPQRAVTATTPGPQYTRVRGHNLGLYPDELPHVLENVHYIVQAGHGAHRSSQHVPAAVGVHGVRRHAAGHCRRAASP